MKIFLTASPEKRAERRCKELSEKGIESSYDEVLADIIKRDYNDSHRAVAPLKPAEDSVILDTSDIDLQASIRLVIDTIKRIIAEKNI